MGYLGRRIGLSQDNGDSNPGAAGGAVGGGLLDLFSNGYFERQGDIYNAPGLPPPSPAGLTATGGVISDYTSGSDVYRAHIFTSSGALNVTALGTFGNTIEYLVIGGGGAGGSDPGNNGASGGGAAGGYRTSLPEGPGGPSPSAESTITASVQPYTITVGGGGGANGTVGVPGSPGNPSTFSTVTSQGGGGGGAAYVSTAPWNGDGRGGGSGGGAGSQSTTSQVAGAGNRVTDPDGPAPNQGYPGGLGYSGPTGTNNQRSGGGGGASTAGIAANSGTPTNGGGGAGKTSTITGTSTNYAGGGTSSNDSNQVPAGNNPGAPYGGGSSGNLPGGYDGVTGDYATGGGGAGNGWDSHPSPAALGGNGGSGIIVVRYKIAQLTATAKATGGAISFYGSKTIHAFTNSGAFNNTSGSPLACEYVIIGGGGGGGGQFGGGGGAGAYITGSNTFAPSNNTTITIGGGGKAGFSGNIATTDGGKQGSQTEVDGVFTAKGGGLSLIHI